MAQFYSPNRRTTSRRQITVVADSLDAAGQGVARIEGKTIFVTGLLPGEEAQIELTEEKRHFAKGKVTKRLSTSPQRVKPRCRYFNQCGGVNSNMLTLHCKEKAKLMP